MSINTEFHQLTLEILKFVFMLPVIILLAAALLFMIAVAYFIRYIWLVFLILVWTWMAYVILFVFDAIPWIN